MLTIAVADNEQEPQVAPDQVYARELGHQVVPTATVRARDLAHHLRTIHDALKAFERDLQNRPGQNSQERVLVDTVSVALYHLQQAIAALELTGRE